MRLLGAAMVKNEADIIEAFVRHNLRYLDSMVVIDHASSDATLRILEALRDEGLPLEILRDPAVAFRQGDRLTAAIREALPRHRAAFAFALDADEFIRAESPDTLRESLERHSAPAVALPWSIHVAPASGSDEPHPLRRLNLRAVSPPASMWKVVVREEFARHPEWMIAQGNHWVIEARDGGHGTLTTHLLPDVVLAHLPFRSPQQFLSKVIMGWFGNRLLQGAIARTSPINWHWREMFDAWLSAHEFGWAEIQEHALRWYALQPTPDAPRIPLSDVRLVDDPLPCDFELRHTPGDATDPLRLLAAWTEGFIDAVRPS